uniref:Plasmodium vivax Vir protein n=1 Tax=Strongyloides papillosus TaxID=174720 RepID=A0A0N5BZA0_STREA
MISINLQVTSLLRSNNIIYKNFCHSTTLLIVTEILLTIDTFLAFSGWFLRKKDKKKETLNVKVLDAQRINRNINFNDVVYDDVYNEFGEPCCQEHYCYNNAYYNNDEVNK